MSNPVILKEALTAFERWEMPQFANVDPRQKKNSNANNPEIVLPTAAELAEVQRQAHEEGYQAGYAEGSQRMTELLNAMEQAMQQTDNEIAQDLLNLSLAVAQQMVQQALKTKPEILLNIIREAINSLPQFSQGAHLLLHPDDAAMVRANIGEQLGHSGWKIFEDAQIARGGVRVETSHSQIDATLANRWQRIVAAIGQDSSWIQE
jgi:flagellar assembly protein FliH